MACSVTTFNTVQRLLDSCTCQLKCSTCLICIHMYSCTCLDATLHSTICKHVHLVHMECQEATGQPPAGVGEETENLKDNHNNYSTYFTNSLPKTIDVNYNTSKTKLQRKIIELQEAVDHCTNVDALNTATGHIQAALSLVNAIQKMPQEKALNRKRSYAPNSNHEHQVFFSTKKKRIEGKTTMRKPTVNQIVDIKEKLQSEEPIFCGVCLNENDKGNSGVVEWIQCSVCTLWLHQRCALDDSNQFPDQYICTFCKAH